MEYGLFALAAKVSYLNQGNSITPRFVFVTQVSGENILVAESNAENLMYQVTNIGLEHDEKIIGTQLIKLRH